MNPLIYSLMPPVSMGILFILGALPENNRWLTPLAMAALGEVVAFFLPLLVFWLLGRKGQSPMKLRLGGSRLRFAPFVFFSALAVSLLSFFLNYLVALFTGGALLEDTAYSAWSQYGGTPTWLLVLVIAFLPALAEELFFRGGLLSGLEGWGQTAAILISALCFAMIHGSTANFLGPLTAGLLFGYMTIITGSVWPAVFGHFFNNLFYLAMSYLLKRYAACLLYTSLDVYAGKVERAPDIFIKLGLEWLYRLLKQPSRLGRMMKLPQYMFAAFRWCIKGEE